MENVLSDVQKTTLEILKDIDRICRLNRLSYSLAYGTVLGAVRHHGFIPWDQDIDLMVNIDSYQHFCDVMEGSLPECYELYSYKTHPEYEYLFARIGLRNAGHLNYYIDLFPMVGMPKSTIGQKFYAKLAYLVFRAYFIKRIDPSSNYSGEPRKRRIALITKALLFPFPPGLFLRLSEKLQRAFPICSADTIYNFCGIYRYKEIISKSYLRDLVQMNFEGHPFPVPKEWDQYLTHMYGDYMTPRKTHYV